MSNGRGNLVPSMKMDIVSAMSDDEADVLDINIVMSIERINSFDYCRFFDNWEGECLIEFTNCKSYGKRDRETIVFFRELSWIL